MYAQGLSIVHPPKLNVSLTQRTPIGLLLIKAGKIG